MTTLLFPNPNYESREQEQAEWDGYNLLGIMNSIREGLRNYDNYRTYIRSVLADQEGGILETIDDLLGDG